MLPQNPPKRLVVLTGAGMSAESGIETFRGAGGLWEGHRVEEVATPEAWERNPDLVLRFYNERRKKLMQSEPNAGHSMLAAWEQFMSVQIVTQNVDDLHERAGSTDVLHLHGELMKGRSSRTTRPPWPLNHWEMKRSDRCPDGHPVRPHIVWFGESVPNMASALPVVQAADFVLVIGTSLQVYPAAQLAFEAAPGVPVCLVDPAAETLGVPGAILIAAGASAGLQAINAHWFPA